MNTLKLALYLMIGMTLSACAQWSEVVSKLSSKECYPLESLSREERAALSVNSGNPILLLDSGKFVCPCYSEAAPTGEGEDDELDGAGEDDELSGRGENQELAGAGEEGKLEGYGERDRLEGAGERDKLLGADEKDRLAGVGEKSTMRGVGESDRLKGAGEGEQLDGAGEKDLLLGDSTKLTCRVVKECPGFQLVDYASDEIQVLSQGGRQSMPASCITW